MRTLPVDSKARLQAKAVPRRQGAGMRIPLSDLRVQYDAIKEEIDEAVGRVIERGEFILGSEVEALEEEIAGYLNVKHAVGVASGTDALSIALRACGIEPGDEVMTTPFTFIATAEAITRCGAKPVFVDIDPKTYNIDPAKIESRITTYTRAIIPVHLYGQAAAMGRILEVAAKHNLHVIEDCAQALGAEHRGEKVGSLGNVGCLSFFPAKNLGAYGDGGMIVTNDAEIAEIATMLRNHGSKISYHYLMHGFNSRLDALQAAILRVKLKHLDDWNELRRSKAHLYTPLLSQIENIEPPRVEGHNNHSFNYYTIRLLNKGIDRAGLREHLDWRGIQTSVYYPLSLHLQDVYKSLGYKAGDFPESELAQEQVLSLPIYPELSEGQIEEVTESIREFCECQTDVLECERKNALG